MRYIYDQFDNYFGKANPIIKLAAQICRPYLQWWDKKSNSNVDLFLPNSKFVEKRVKKYYGEETPTKVVYPFVDLDDFKEIQRNPPEKEDFYLMVTAFAPNNFTFSFFKSLSYIILARSLNLTFGSHCSFSLAFE